MIFPFISLPFKKFQSVVNTNLTKRLTPYCPRWCASSLEISCINFIPELLRVSEIFSNFEKQTGVYQLAYKSCYKEIYVSLYIEILLLVLYTRCFLHILIITHINEDMNHFTRVGIFNSGVHMTDVGRWRLTLIAHEVCNSQHAWAITIVLSLNYRA